MNGRQIVMKGLIEAKKNNIEAKEELTKAVLDDKALDMLLTEPEVYKEYLKGKTMKIATKRIEKSIDIGVKVHGKLNK